VLVLEIEGENAMKSACVLALVLVAASLAPAAAQSTERLDDFRMRAGNPTELKEVAPGLFFLYDDLSSNAGFLVTEEGVLVVDTRQHPAHGRDLIERIRKITDKPIKWAINTHAHGDHFLGNPEFKKVGATIIAHSDTLAGIVKNQEVEVKRRMAFFRAMNLDPAEVKVVLPDVTFDSRLTITLGGRAVEIFYIGPGQNPGDTLVHFPHARTLYVGGRGGTCRIRRSRPRSTAGSRCWRRSPPWTSTSSCPVMATSARGRTCWMKPGCSPTCRSR
jgi:hypothetical protein